MKPLTAASAITILLAPVQAGPARAVVQPFVYYRPDLSDHGSLGYGSPNFPPPAYAARIDGRASYAQTRYAVSRYAPQIPPGYDPERPARSGWRRGQHLPPDFRGDIVTDYARYHLRRPPRGYCWYRDADDYVLAAESTT
jgi:hypothetical protein